MDAKVRELRRDKKRTPLDLERAGDFRGARIMRVRAGTAPVSDFATKLVRRPAPNGMVPWQFYAWEWENDVRLSIQAGNGLYSEPRRYYRDALVYTRFELGAVPSSLGQVANMVEWGYLAWLDEENPPEAAQIDSFTVASYVDKKTVQQMLDVLYIEHGDPLPFTGGSRKETLRPARKYG